MTYSANPRISFITATFQGRERLGNAIASLLAQSDPRWEMVISPDDGENYAALAERDPRIRVVASEARRSGPGPARNRGLDLATGTYIAVLDDDDTLAPDFVAKVLAALEHADAVTVPTTYVSEQGEAIREIGAARTHIGIRDFAAEFGSMHVIGRREPYPRWQSCFAQDVLHTCEAIDMAGGEIPVVQGTRYYCTVRGASTCATRADIDAEYARIIDMHIGRFTAARKQEARALFQIRRAVNAAFVAQRRIGESYQEFVRSLRFGNSPEYRF